MYTVEIDNQNKNVINVSNNINSFCFGDLNMISLSDWKNFYSAINNNDNFSLGNNGNNSWYFTTKSGITTLNIIVSGNNNSLECRILFPTEEILPIICKIMELVPYLQFDDE